MNGERGAKVVAKLRELHPRLPMLHLDDGAGPPPAEFPGDVPTISKPVSQDVLLERIHALLARSGDQADRGVSQALIAAVWGSGCPFRDAPRGQLPSTTDNIALRAGAPHSP